MKSSKVSAEKMITTVNILDLLYSHFGSDYKTAKALGVTQSRITKMRNAGGVLTNEQGLQAAEILDFPKELILLSLAAERALNSPAFEILTHIASQYDHRKVSSFLVLALVPIFAVFSNLTSAVS